MIDVDEHKRVGRRVRHRDGFTLIELLVALMLSMVLIGAILQTFETAMEVFDEGTARMDIYSNVRSAMDVLERDIAGMIPTDTGGQRFVLAQNVDQQFPEGTVDRFGGGQGQGGDFGRTNGWIMEAGTPEQPNGGAADMIGFIGDTVVAGEKEKVGIMYQIAPIRDPSLMETELGGFKTVKSNRIVTALKRVTISPASEITGERSKEQDGESSEGTESSGEEQEEDRRGNVGLYYGPSGPGGPMWNPSNAGLKARSAQSSEQITREASVGYLSQYILSFNIEVLPDNNLDNGFIDLNATNNTEQTTLSDYEKKFLNPSDNFRDSEHYPIGDGSKGEPDLPDAIRVTIRFTDGRKEVQERVVQRVFWVPVD